MNHNSSTSSLRPGRPLYETADAFLLALRAAPDHAALCRLLRWLPLEPLWVRMQVCPENDDLELSLQLLFVLGDVVKRELLEEHSRFVLRTAAEVVEEWSRTVSLDAWSEKLKAAMAVKYPLKPLQEAESLKFSAVDSTALPLAALGGVRGGNATKSVPSNLTPFCKFSLAHVSCELFVSETNQVLLFVGDLGPRRPSFILLELSRHALEATTTPGLLAIVGLELRTVVRLRNLLTRDPESIARLELD